MHPCTDSELGGRASRRYLVGVLILLPPSEGKTAPAQGPNVALDELSHPELTDARSRVGSALAKVSAQKNALAVLHAGPSLAPEVQRNTTLWDNPAAPAAQVYSGVLYDAAGASAWDAAALARAHERVRVVSALWGAISPCDRIPAYRLSMGTTLPRLGGLAALWRARLGAALDPLASGPVVDCRSSDYMAAWRAPHATLAVRVEQIRGGKRTVVSHNAKHTRGLLTGALVHAQQALSTNDEVAHIANGLPGVTAVELRPGVLTLVTA